MRATRITIGAVALCFGAVPWQHAAEAQQIFHGELTIVATGSEEPTDELPLSVTVITRDEIDDAQQPAVAEMLRRVPGVTVVRSGDRGSVTSVFTRGTESDHTLALFDGVRLNSPYFGGYDWSLLPTAGIDRVEVARGPFSAVWGSDAIGGVVNVVPVRGVDGLQATVVGELGGEDWQRVEGSVRWAAGGLDLTASAVDRSGRGTLDNSDFAGRQVLVNAGWSWGDGNRVALLVQDLASEVGIPFSSPESPTPNRRQASDQRLLAVPLRVHLAEAWDVELVASQVARRFDFRDPDDPFGFTSSGTDADTLQLRFTSRHAAGLHSLSWGAEWRDDEVSDTSSFGTNLEARTGDVVSLFAQDVWRPTADLRLIAGMRWDDADEWGDQLSPRLAVGWAVSRGLKLRAAYGRAFRQPSLGELYFPFSGNPDLEPERSRSVELGAEIKTGADRIELNLFDTQIGDLIDFDYASYAFSNVQQAAIRGVEAAWDRPIGTTVVSSVQATWLDAEDAAGLPLLRRPTWSASWTLDGRFGRRWRGDVAILWVGSRADVDPSTFERVELPDHLTAHLAAAYRLGRALELTARINNLADAGYQEIAGYPAPGRQLVGGIRWQHR